MLDRKRPAAAGVALAAVVAVAAQLGVTDALARDGEGQGQLLVPAGQEASSTWSFDIPAQPLPQAVAAFSAATGLEVLYTDDAPYGVESNAVSGNLTAEDALRRMLEGTGLLYRFTEGGAVTLETIAVQESVPLQLGAITVTGEKMDRSLQDTAASVSVLTAEAIDEKPGTFTLEEALRGMPNVLDPGSDNFAPTIRGDDATGPANGVFAFLGGVRPRVTVQQDGRPLTFNEFIYGNTDLWDVEQVELLRGPQTTLQGRNSIAGAIIVDTKDPEFDYGAAGRSVVGNYDTFQYSGMVTGPIVEDQLAFRLAYDERRQDSWVELTGPAGTDNPDQERDVNMRAKLLLEPTRLPEFSAMLTLNRVDTRRPQTELVVQPYDQRTNPGVGGMFPVFDNRADSVILELAHDLTNDLTLRNTATYANIEINRQTSIGSGIADIHTKEQSNELLAEYDTDDLRGVLGTYFFHSKSNETIDIGGGAFDDRTQSAAIFGEATVTFLEDFDMTLGGRYEHEDRERIGSAAIFVIDLNETYEAFLPKAGLAWHATDDLTVGTTVQRGFNPGGAGITFVPPFPSYVYEAEYVWNYEAYARSEWLNDRLVLNANVFYADYTDQQRLAYLIPGNANSGVIRNAEKTHSYGAEITVDWLATDELQVYAGLGLLQTEIDEFTASVQNLDGNEFGRAPDVTASIGGIWRHDSGFSVGGNVQYVGSYFSADDNLTSEEVSAFTLVDAQVGYELGDNVRTFAYVTNIFDAGDVTLYFGGGTAEMVDPREFGAGLEITF